MAIQRQIIPSLIPFAKTEEKTSGLVQRMEGYGRLTFHSQHLKTTQLKMVC